MPVGQKILVVEDNELNLKLFCDLLRAHGYEAEPVRDGREAVARARDFAPDLVVMDIQMPHVSGLELIEAMKTDAELMVPWALKRDGQTIFSMPRAAVWRSFVMNHLVHHRAQLSVYLRLLDVPVPSMYGPSADEGAF